MVKILFKKDFPKKLSKIPKKDKQNIEDFIANLCDCQNPKSLPNCKKLSGYSNYYRYRIGNYRIVCEITEQGEIVILFLDVAHRQNIYNFY